MATATKKKPLLGIMISPSSLAGIRADIERIEAGWIRAVALVSKLSRADTSREVLALARELVKEVETTERIDTNIARWCKMLNDNHFPPEAVREAGIERHKLQAASFCMRSPVPDSITMTNPGAAARSAFERIEALCNKS